MSVQSETAAEFQDIGLGIIIKRTGSDIGHISCSERMSCVCQCITIDPYIVCHSICFPRPEIVIILIVVHPLGFCGTYTVQTLGRLHCLNTCSLGGSSAEVTACYR